MSTSIDYELAEGTWHGLRMTAEEFLALPESSQRYELIDGVIFMSPSPTPIHQRIAKIILTQLDAFVEARGLGEVFYDMDVYLGRRSGGGDIVYRPDVFYLDAKHRLGAWQRLRAVPALVVEVVSPKTRAIDSRTKRDDYERFGVQEYWLVDPERKSVRVHHLEDGRYLQVDCEDEAYPSRALPGFTMDLTRIRKHFEDQ